MRYFLLLPPLVLGLSLFLSYPKRPSIQTSYTIGSLSAPDEMLLFEEFACGPCQEFQKKMLPKILNTLVSTGKVRLTIIPTAFLEESEEAFAKAIAILNTKPDLFIPFLLGFVSNPKNALKEKELDYAIDLNRSLLEKRSQEEIYLPSLFINEVRCEVFDF